MRNPLVITRRGFGQLIFQKMPLSSSKIAFQIKNGFELEVFFGKMS